jgi:hypothetical protein
VVVVEPGATYFNSAPCDGRGLELGDSTVDSDKTLRAFVTEEDPRPFRRCFDYSPPEGCDDVEPERASVDLDARLSLRLSRQVRGPVAVHMLGENVYARAEWQGTTYSLSTVAAGATGASELSFRVASSDTPRIAWAVIGARPGLSRCYAENRDSGSCLPTVQVSVDDEPPEDADTWPYGIQRGWGRLVPGQDHVVTLRVVEGDPRYLDLGVWVYQED